MGDCKYMKRKKIGLVYFNNEEWIGGTYYTINLIHALNILPDNDKPQIIAFSTSLDFYQLQDLTNYPYLSYEDFSKSEFSKYEKLLNKISVKFFKRKLLQKKFKQDIDVLFLMQRSEYLESIPIEKRIYWIADFQDKHYPEYFTAQGLELKHSKSTWIEQNAQKLILSSQSVKIDWEKFYPNYKGKVFVLNFAVTHPEFESLNIELLKEKYNLSNDFFFSPNQFWAHKNHIIVLKAAQLLKKMGKPFCFVFSGKENDNRNPGYTNSLKEYVHANGLDDVIKFLGFIDRREQLKLMKYARAIIQPSLFEGWSTVIEDAKSINQFVIASHIDVHKNQLGNQGSYFDPFDENNLVNCILSVINNKPVVNYNYDSCVKEFANQFIKL